MKYVALSEACQINPRISPIVATEKDRIVDFVPMAQLGSDGRITTTESRRLGDVLKGYRYFENGDVIVAKITPCMENGKAAHVQSLPHGIAFGSTEFHVLRPHQGIDPRYIFYSVWTPEFRQEAANNMTGTGGQQRVPASFFDRFTIPLPPLAEQRRISDILDKADGIRRKRWEANQAGDALQISAFQETFREYLTPTAHYAPLSDVAEVVSGVAKGRNLGSALTREVPYLRVANVQAGHLDLSEVKMIPAKESEIQELALQSGDLVLTEGGDHDKLGRGALWEHDLKDCIHQNHVFRVRTNRRKLLPTFFVHFLQTQHARNYFLRCAKKTTNLASINMTQLKALPVSQPPMELQQRFDVELTTIRTAINRQKSAELGAESLFQALVQQSFSGNS
jgi:type I restriction enzyme S subunit